ncbi:MAG: photosystem I reaction center subunit PsaK [Xenococcus sp. (in: cyanobacteria)]
MLYSTLIATTSSFPLSDGWTPTIGIVMILCNVIAIAFGKATMPNPGVGPALPMPEMFGGMGWAGLLATTSLGHIVGILTIVLLDTYGVI